MTGSGLLCLAVKLPRAGAGRRELRINLAAAGDWSIHSQAQTRHPTKYFEIFLVRAERERGYLHRIFLDRRLILGRRANRKQRHEQAYAGASNKKSLYQNAPPEVIKFVGF